MTECPSPELTQVAELLRETLARCILPYFGKLEASDIGEKGPQDFVTIADTTAEAFLTERLTALLPGSRVVGEEGAAADPSLLETLGNGVCWIIDPVDGTLLFKNSQPRFGTLVSRSLNGETQAGWILDTFATPDGLGNAVTMGDRKSGVWHSPAEGEPFRRVPAFAERGDNGKPNGIVHPRGFVEGVLRPDLPDRIADAATEFEWSDELYSAVSLYNAVILGDSRAFIAAPSMPWDHAAGTFMVQLLGGLALHLSDESPYRPTRHTTGVATAWNEETWRRAQADALLPLERRTKGDPDKRRGT